MKIGFTSNTCGGAEAKVINEVTLHMEELMQNALLDKNYGGKIDNVIFVPVAIFSEPKLNQPFVDKVNKIERGKDFYGNRYSSVCFGISFDPDAVGKMSVEDFRQLLSIAMIEQLKKPTIKFPKVFDYEQFRQELIQIIEIYRNSIFN